MTDIHTFMIEQYKRERLKKVTPATVNREIEKLKHMFNKAKNWKLATENPVGEVSFLKVEQRDVVILTPEKTEELLNEIKSQLLREPLLLLP